MSDIPQDEQHNTADSSENGRTDSATRETQEQTQNPRVAAMPNDTIVDFSAESEKRSKQAVRGRPRKPKPERAKTNDWRDELLRDDNGKLQKRSLNNAYLFLDNSPEFAGAFKYDAWRCRPVVARRLPWHDKDGDFHTNGNPILDEDMTEIARWLERQGQSGFNGNNVAEIVLALCSHNKFNPLLDYLNGIRWDGKPRIDSWLTYYLGAKHTLYTQTIGAKYLIGAVARAYRPGCKMDNILILEGEQGILKSTALKTLFGADYFTDQMSELGSKDSSLQLQGIWCVELAELTQMDRSESRAIKEWLSRSTERFRPPFGRAVREFGRQCVIAGTTNPEGEYLKDSTGARRMWPVGTVNADIEALASDRAQLWAEAVHRYKANEPWWLTTEDEKGAALMAQRGRYDHDVWHDEIKDYISGRNFVRISELLNYLGVDREDLNLSMKRRVAKELTHLGWACKVMKMDGKPARVWSPGGLYIKYIASDEMEAAAGIDGPTLPGSAFQGAAGYADESMELADPNAATEPSLPLEPARNSFGDRVQAPVTNPVTPSNPYHPISADNHDDIVL